VQLLKNFQHFVEPEGPLPTNILQEYEDIITDLIKALPGNSSVNAVQHATIEEAVFSVDPTDAPVGWLDSNHVVCVFSRYMSVPQLQKKY
jgi:hypothetical protein